ncbi:MAG: MFS transporter, partial [Clostridia bacterium]|nr:MFS transporter [Clostridia bacterium]
DFDVPLSFAGIISMIICGGTIVSSLLSERLTKKFGTGLVTAVSVTMTAVALFLFSISTQYWMLVVFAIPYGLGAGGVDASLNNYVALHLKARHMSWLHCMWGVGAAVSPYIMSYAVTGGRGWSQGYFIVAVIQICLSAMLFASLPLWKKCAKRNDAEKAAEEPGTQVEEKPVSLKQIIKIRGAVACFICFFCYCALEQTTMLWASSYMISHNGVGPEEAAKYASLFFIGITVGRGVNGFLTLKFSDKTLIRTGQALIFIGVALIVVPSVRLLTVAGLIIIGLGCAPVYPSIIHMTPSLFGEDRSQAMIGVQMASAYTGSCLAPPLYGLIANHVTPRLLPAYLIIFLVLMVIMHEIVVGRTKSQGLERR